ncbi:phosphoadenylyl-sulfate reductase [Ferrimonas balearica]|uniref:phosphoadenylyl-sulfate reductase n=1 Tax=Ferrimonas balearica TaxID=44012 RepID=UPI001C560037|nr:phosphoadenylyl-sulfate reductase [Ferrimonas balearica]MBW3164652.1 phosphoadenylyl-sulfate reductase [Ferrimonas balearica]MBY6224180.1 phosphoadenylyl-sulfate reductase [Ferrimonas balearica]
MASQALLDVLSEPDAPASQASLTDLNRELAGLSAEQRVAWGLEQLPGEHALSSSFGIQAAVMLKLVTAQRPDTPVILTDTGHLFPETYRFIDELTERLGLNLQVFRAELSPAWQEARYGREWEQGQDGIDRYNRRNKVVPMQRALETLGIGSWFAGLRREQASSRAELPFLEVRSGRFKLLPILDWSNKQVHQYLTEHELPYHPLWHEGYVSVGDTHTSRPLELGMTEEETRFHGLKRECGLHYEI